MYDQPFFLQDVDAVRGSDGFSVSRESSFLMWTSFDRGQRRLLQGATPSFDRACGECEEARRKRQKVSWVGGEIGSGRCVFRSWVSGLMA